MSDDPRNEVPVDYPAALAAVDAFFNEPGTSDERRALYESVLSTMGDGDSLGDAEVENMRRMFSNLGVDDVRGHIKDHIEGDEWFGDDQVDRYKRLHEAYRDAFTLGKTSGKPLISVWNRTVDVVSGSVIDTPIAIVVTVNTPPTKLTVSLKTEEEVVGMAPADVLDPAVVHQSGVRAVNPGAY